MLLTIGSLTVKIFRIDEDKKEIYFKNVCHKTGELIGAFQMMNYISIINLIRQNPRGARVFKTTKNAAIYWKIH